MKKISLLAALLALAAPLAAAPVALAPAAGSAVWIEGDSTLHAFASTSTAFGLEVSYDKEAKKPAKLELKVPVASLKSHSGALDKNLRKAMNADEHPEVLFALESYKAEGEKVSATGNLTINGQTKPATVEGVLSEKDGKLAVDGAYTLLMSDFGIKPPKMMMGAVKVADKVTVKFKLALAEKK